MVYEKLNQIFAVNLLELREIYDFLSLGRGLRSIYNNIPFCAYFFVQLIIRTSPLLLTARE